jgi:protein TonB
MSSLEQWKCAAADRIQAANWNLVFTGPPPMPLHAVVVIEYIVASDGRLITSKVMRAPDHALECGPVALRTLKLAAPFPAVPRELLKQGTLAVLETWLFREDGKFQIRSVAEAQQQA